MEPILPHPKVVGCPVCGFPLRGAARTGYRCFKCHAHYSTRFVRHLRREHLRSLVATHFEKRQEPPRAAEEPCEETRVRQDVVRIPEAEVVRALSEAKAAVQGATQHLEDFLDLSQPDVIERLKAAAPQTPQEANGPPLALKQAYTTTQRPRRAHTTPVKVKTMRSRAVKKSSRKTTSGTRKRSARAVTRRRP